MLSRANDTRVKMPQSFYFSFRGEWADLGWCMSTPVSSCREYFDHVVVRVDGRRRGSSMRIACTPIRLTVSTGVPEFDRLVL